MSVDNQFTICHFKQLDVLTWRLDNIIKCTDKKKQNITYVVDPVEESHEMYCVLG